jgi:hypothetical protein
VADQDPAVERGPKERRLFRRSADRDALAYWRRTARNLYFGVAMTAGGILILLTLLWVGFGQIQDSRLDATRDACLATWKSNSGIHEFVLGPPLPGRPAPPSADSPLGQAIRARLDDKFPLIAPPAARRLAFERCTDRARKRTAVGP